MESVIIQRFKKVTEKYNISVTALGGIIGIHPSTLNRQFSGESAMSLNTVVAFLQYFKDVSAEWLLRGEGEMTKGDPSLLENEFVVYVDENGFVKLKR